ncbi:MAG: hypothetical protein J4F97_03360 [Pseudomonadales bacterium]|nr:hypothetical protein [Pseudomonadales bacterium]
MSVYKHEQGTYRSYRVARSINGKLHQAYFPRSRDGWRKAKELDQQWAEQQATAQRKFTGSAMRWNPDRLKNSGSRRGPKAAGTRTSRASSPKRETAS